MDSEVVGTFEQDGAGGLLRRPAAGYQPSRDDIQIPAGVCREARLRGGETVVVRSAAAKNRNRRPSITRTDDICSINDLPVLDYAEQIPFEKLTAIDPRAPVRFETPGGPPSMRVVDLMTPIGFGQRGLIVAPPRTGKTVLLQQMAHGVAVNHPNVYAIVLLIDERPEEVTEMRRTVRGEVVASSNDEDIASHVRIARLVIAKAKRLVECGKDVFVLLDSLTRLGRAFNARLRSGGRIMSGGLDSQALTEPKSMFGAARNAEHGGSLTIIASSLIETGSRMDEVIFNEFKGTGNMEIMLSRELANKRLWPAIDLNRSGTRKEELLLSPGALALSHRIRRTFLDRGEERAMTAMLELLGGTKDNAELIARESRDHPVR